MPYFQGRSLVWHWHLIIIGGWQSYPLPLLYATLRKRSAKQAFGIGWAYGFGLWFVGAFWLYTSIHVYGDTNSALSVGMIGIMALVMGLFAGCPEGFIYRRFFP